MSTALIAKLDEMLGLVQALEADPAKFSAVKIARIVELNKDLFDGYSLVSGNEEAAQALDRRLDNYLRTTDVGASAFRQVLLQLHTVGFLLGAGGNLGKTAAYNFAVELRDRDARADGVYFRVLGAPKLLDPINTAIPVRLRLEILATIARLEIAFAVPPIIENEMDDPSLFKIPRAEFVLGIVRRWEESSRQNLAAQPHTVENRLLGQGHFQKMAEEDPVLHELFGPRGIAYIPKIPFWTRIKRAFARFFDWLGEVVRYFPGAARTQRARLITMVGLLFLGLAIAFGVFLWWDMKKLNEDLDNDWNRGRSARPAGGDAELTAAHAQIRSRAASVRAVPWPS